MFQCIDVSAQLPGQSYEVGGSINPLNYSPESCLIFTGFYSDRECLNLIGRQDFLLPSVPTGIWSRRVTKTDPIPNTTQGISFSMDCRFASDTPSPETRFDDAIVRPAASPFTMYPQLALGAGFDVILFVTNMSDQNWTGRAELDAGSWPEDRTWTLDGIDQTGNSGFDLELASRETKRVELGSSQGPFSGWLEITPNGEARAEELATAFFYNFTSGDKLADSTGVAPAALTAAVWFPVARRPGLNTGLAIRRPEAPVRYSLYDSAGIHLETVTREDFQGAQFFNEVFSGVPASFTGSVKVESDRGFYLTVLRQEILAGAELSFQLTSIPATPVPIELVDSNSD